MSQVSVTSEADNAIRWCVVMQKAKPWGLHKYEISVDIGAGWRYAWHQVNGKQPSASRALRPTQPPTPCGKINGDLLATYTRMKRITA